MKKILLIAPILIMVVVAMTQDAKAQSNSSDVNQPIFVVPAAVTATPSAPAAPAVIPTVTPTPPTPASPGVPPADVGTSAPAGVVTVTTLAVPLPTAPATPPPAPAVAVAGSVNVFPRLNIRPMSF